MIILGNGIDIVNIKRVELSSDKNPGFLARMLTDKEIEYCKRKKNFYEHAAGRIALKEAAYKAVKDSGITLLWREMEIESSGFSPRLSGDCIANRKLSDKNISYSFSISHEKKYAVGSAFFWQDI